MRTQQLPGIFDATIFSPPRRGLVSASTFIRAMHPKTEIAPTQLAVDKILKAGWVGQIKIHGHRAQVHLNANPTIPPIVYNRQGRPHKMALPEKIAKELRRIFVLSEGWTVLDGEWLKPEGILYIFDILKLDGKLLRTQTYAERYSLLPKSYISPSVKTLSLLTTLPKCMEVLASEDKQVEGLVFKSLSTKGFEDTSIIRCRIRHDCRTRRRSSPSGRRSF